MKIKLLTKEIIESKVKECYSIRQLCKALEIPIYGSTYTRIKEKLSEFQIDCSHFTGKLWSKGENYTDKTCRRKLSEIMQPHTKYSSDLLHKRLITEGLKLNKCEICGLSGNDYVLELHHMNCDHFDNRLENLLILCPNHHRFIHHKIGKGERIIIPDAPKKEKPVCTCMNCGKEFASDRCDRIRKFCSVECYRNYVKQNGSRNVQRIGGHDYNDNNFKLKLEELASQYSTIKEISDQLHLHRVTVRDLLKRFGLYERFKNKK